MKKICSIICIAVPLLLLSGCFDRRELNELAYVAAIGLDKGSTNFLRLTFQIATPKSGGGGEGQSSGDSEESFMVTSIEAPSIYSAFNMVNTYVSRQLNLSHVNAVVFSKALCEEGIDKYLRAIVRGREFRPNMFVLVSRTTAEEYINSVKPKIQINAAEYYESILRGHSHTGFSAKSQFSVFYENAQSTCKQPVAILVGTGNFKKTEDINTLNSTFKDKGRDYPLEGDFKAGDVPKVGGLTSQVMGLGVFDGTKMVGELDGEETTYYLIATGELNYVYWTIPDPKMKDRLVILNLKQRKSPKFKVILNNNTPLITANIFLEGDILSIQSGINYEDINNIDVLEKAVESSIKKGMNDFFVKTSQEFKSDICGFGASVRKKFLTWQQWDDYKWKQKYSNSIFNVNVDMKIRRTGLMIKSGAFISSE